MLCWRLAPKVQARGLVWNDTQDAQTYTALESVTVVPDATQPRYHPVRAPDVILGSIIFDGKAWLGSGMQRGDPDQLPSKR